ncbi:MAG: hypothetical protein RMK84_00835 [Oscillochloridaceae bacterium]|nr:hypothetical protein [Chloroflexaceae bacterium]MDW8388642.1 hypothetical protein [Oscillochloridaceae bacterium]
MRAPPDRPDAASLAMIGLGRAGNAHGWRRVRRTSASGAPADCLPAS